MCMGRCDTTEQHSEQGRAAGSRCGYWRVRNYSPVKKIIFKHKRIKISDLFTKFYNTDSECCFFSSQTMLNSTQRHDP